MTDNLRGSRQSLGKLIRAGAPAYSPLAGRGAWTRLRATLDRQQTTRARRPRRVVVVAAVVAAGLLLAAGLGRWGRDGTSPQLSMTYDLDRGAIEQDGVIRAVDRAGAGATAGSGLRFSDGSRVILRAAARARVVSLEKRGARIVVAEGEVSADVVHRPQTHWRFDAGPFSIYVEGTSFSLAWSELDQRLRLRMYSGVVRVTGPVGTEPIRVSGGETLTVGVREHSVALQTGTLATEDTPPTSVLVPPVSASASEVGGAPSPSAPAASEERAAFSERRGAGPTTPGPRHQRTVTAARARWRDLIAAGRSADVVADAEKRGLGAILAGGDSEDLTALADAARYSRRNDVARRALHALRDRFPSSNSAHDAAFFLGRIEEYGNGTSSRSLEWYRRYRAEATNGLYVSDSLGREMLIMHRLYGETAARDLAREYLARFPRGPLARQAAEIQERGFSDR